MSFLSPECPYLYYGEGYHKYSDKSRLSKATSTHPGLYTKGIIETPDVHPNPASPAVDLGPPKRGELSGLSGYTHFSLNVSAIELDVNLQGRFSFSSWDAVSVYSGDVDSGSHTGGELTVVGMKRCVLDSG